MTNFVDLMHTEVARALQFIDAAGFNADADAQIAPCAIFAYNDGRPARRMEVTWRDYTEKKAKMHMVGIIAAAIQCDAIIFLSDVRFLDTKVFCERFSIPEPKGPEDLDSFETARQRVMEGFGGYMGNLPRDCYKEAITAAAIGKSVSSMSAIEYKWEGRKMVKSEMAGPETAAMYTNYLVPEFWTAPYVEMGRRASIEMKAAIEMILERGDKRAV